MYDICRQSSTRSVRRWAQGPGKRNPEDGHGGCESGENLRETGRGRLSRRPGWGARRRRGGGGGGAWAEQGEAAVAAGDGGWIHADTGRGRPPWLVVEGVAPVKLVGWIWPVPGEWRRWRLHHSQIQRRRCLPIRRRRARAPWLRLPRGGAKGTKERGGQGPSRSKRREHWEAAWIGAGAMPRDVCVCVCVG